MPKILIKKSNRVEAELEIVSETTTIGRDPANALVLADESVSRRHAKIELAGGRYRIVDLDSGNGILHRGKRVDSLELYPGCEMEIGIYTLEYHSEEERTPKLILIGGAKQQTFDVAKDETVVGRSSDVQISIGDSLVSSSHLKILKRGDLWALVDLDSQNGTFVNGVRVSESELKHGDQIRLGGLTLLFSETGDVPEAGSVPMIEAVQARRDTTPLSQAVEPPPSAGASLPSGKIPARTGLFASVPRWGIIAGGAFIFCLLLLVMILMWSPEDTTEKEFQEVFQADLSEEGRERIQEYLSQAEEYEEGGGLALALEQYRKILVLNGNHQKALAESARLEERLEEQAQVRAGQEQEEREKAAQVAELTVQADELVSQGEFDEGRKRLEEALALSPESEVLTGKLAATHVVEGDRLRSRNPGRARGAYQEALKLDPENEAAKRGIGRIDAGRRAARERSERIERFTAEGLAQLKREEYQEAYASFSEVLQADPDNTRAKEFRDQARLLLEQKVQPMYEEGVRLYNNDELVAAMGQFNRILEIYPDHSETRTFMQRALERTRSEAMDKYKRAYINEGLGRFKEAMELYREALALLPDPKEDYHQKAAQRIEELNRKLR